MARLPYPPAGTPLADHPLNLFRMLAHSPQLLEGFAKLGGALLMDSSLDARLREIAILRVGLTQGARYEVEKHVPIAKATGVSDEEIATLAPNADQAPLGAAERAVVALTDELAIASRASDAALQAVREHLSDRAVIELVVTIGYYGMVCRVLETLGVDLEEPS